MEDKNAWWKKFTDAGVNMGKKPLIVVSMIAIGLISFAAWSALRASHHGSWPAPSGQEEKINDLEDRVARLQKELDDASKQIATLQRGAEEPARVRRSEQRREYSSRREQSRPTDQPASTAPAMYETARNTAVYEQPSTSSRTLATIPRGSRVRVVNSTGDWLEVRSKQGRPPGFIHRDDAVPAR
jgi:uncharacterized protein YgiM (DUF1202 family)